ILDTAAERKIVRAQKFDVAHEPEGTRAADFLHKGSAGEIHARGLGTAAKNRMIEIDLETHLETVKRKEGSPLVPIFHRNLAGDADEFLMGVLFFQACRLNQEHEWPCTAIHDRHFGGGQL